MNNLDSQLVGKIFEEYKRLYFAVKQRKKQNINLLKQYCMKLVPLVRSIKGYEFNVSKEYLEKCIGNKLREVIRHLYINRLEFVRMIIEFLKKIIKQRKDEIINKMQLGYNEWKAKGMIRKKPRLKLETKSVEIDNSWIEEVRTEVLESLRFDGKTRYYAEKLVDVILRHGESLKVPKYIRDIVYFLLRRAIINRFGYYSKIFNPRLELIRRILWKS